MRRSSNRGKGAMLTELLHHVRGLFRLGLRVVVAMVVALILVSRVSLAQDFSVFATPSKHLVLADEGKGEATFLGGQYLDGPLLGVVNGTPHIVVIGLDFGIWTRTNTTEWRNLGGRCHGLKTIKNTTTSLNVEALCFPSDVWNVPIVPSGKSEKLNSASTNITQVLKPLFIDDRFAVYRNPAKGVVVVDTTTLKVHSLKGELLQDPHVQIINNEVTVFGVGFDNAIWTRSLSRPWRSLGGRTDVITSVTSSADGTDATIVIPGKSADTILSRTLTSEWRESSPFADYPIDLASITGDPSETLGPVTQVDKYLEAFIDAWGDDIVTLRTLQTQAEFEQALPTLKTTVLETKLIQQFSSTSLRDIVSKLLMAFPRSKYSDGAAAAMKAYLTSLGQDKAGVCAAFSSVIKSLPDDPIAEQRSVVLDLFSRVPGITDTYRSYLLASLQDAQLGIAPGQLSTLGKKYFAVMLGHALLATSPAPEDAKSGVASAIKVPVDPDQAEDLKAALQRYLDYVDSFLMCTSSGCTPRPQKGGACSTSAPCMLGLQCFKGICTEFGEKDDPCGTNKPFCHPSLTCSGDYTSVSRTCIERAKLGESCKERACQYGLACLKALGICVDTAEENEACAGISKPCVDGATLACVGGYCKKRGTLDKPCSSDLPCIDSLTCSDPKGGTCRNKRALGQACSPSDPCQAGLTCYSSFGVVGTTPGGICKETVGKDAPCGGMKFCDSSQGLFCGSRNVCRTPGLQEEYCAEDGECLPGLLCNSGACRVRQGSSGTCEVSEHCLDDFICDKRELSSTKNTCIPKGGQNAPCPCMKGYSCVGEGTSLVCKADVGEGGSCGAGFGSCGAGLTCFGGGVMGIGTCKSLGGEGSSCGFPFHPPCAAGFYCTKFGKCTSGGGSGAHCWGWIDNIPCSEGFKCKITNTFGTCSKECSASEMDETKKPDEVKCASSQNYACRRLPNTWWQAAYGCMPKLPFQSPCSPVFDQYTPPCRDDLFCSPTLKTCQFRSRATQSCTTDGSQPCLKNSYCSNGRCVCYPGWQC